LLAEETGREARFDLIARSVAARSITIAGRFAAVEVPASRLIVEITRLVAWNVGAANGVARVVAALSAVVLTAGRFAVKVVETLSRTIGRRTALVVAIAQQEKITPLRLLNLLSVADGVRSLCLTRLLSLDPHAGERQQQNQDTDVST
jgi:hypothetical protein